MGSDTDYVLDDLKEHPRVCATCFTLRHYEDPIPPKARRLQGRTQWAAAVTEEWTRTRWTAVESPPGETISEWAPRTVCTECGAFHHMTEPLADEHGNTPVLDLDTVIDYVGHIDHTLDTFRDEYLDREKPHRAVRFAHDTDVLYQTARYLKRSDRGRLNDSLVFTAATELACRHGELETEPDGGRALASAPAP